MTHTDDISHTMDESYNTHTHTHTHMHTHTKYLQISFLLLLAGHEHHTMTVQAKLKVSGRGAWLGTRIGLSSQQVVRAPEVPPGPLLFHEKRP